MKTVDYTNISLGMEVSPRFEAQIQEGSIDRIAALIKALSNSSSQIVIIHGCVMSVTGSGTIYNQTAGVVYYQGDLHTVDAFSGSHATQVPVYLPGSVYDRQAWYGDTVKRDTFYLKKLKLQLGTSGSGIANYNGVVRLETKILEFVNMAGVLLPYATLNNPFFTGNPQVPNRGLGDNSLSAANTAFVQAAIAALVDSAPALLNTLDEISAALNDDPNAFNTLMNAIAGKVAKTGDSMTGPLTIPNGTTSGHAVNKGQLDAEALARASAVSAEASARAAADSALDTQMAHLITKIVDIGDWNMDTTVAVSVAHGLTDISKIRSVTVMVRNDLGSVVAPIEKYSNLLDFGGGISGFTASDITLERKTSGTFDASDYSATSFNRGWITIQYLP